MHKTISFVGDDISFNLSILMESELSESLRDSVACLCTKRIL